MMLNFKNFESQIILCILRYWKMRRERDGSGFPLLIPLVPTSFSSHKYAALKFPTSTPASAASR